MCYTLSVSVCSHVCVVSKPPKISRHLCALCMITFRTEGNLQCTFLFDLSVTLHDQTYVHYDCPKRRFTRRYKVDDNASCYPRTDCSGAIFTLSVLYNSSEAWRTWIRGSLPRIHVRHVSNTPSYTHTHMKQPRCLDISCSGGESKLLSWSCSIYVFVSHLPFGFSKSNPHRQFGTSYESLAKTPLIFSSVRLMVICVVLVRICFAYRFVIEGQRCLCFAAIPSALFFVLFCRNATLLTNIQTLPLMFLDNFANICVFYLQNNC